MARPTTTLDDHFERIWDIPLLTPERERELLERVHATGDQDARRELAVHNQRFVIMLAKRYRSFGVDLIELIQEGNIGLMKAIDKFDPSKGSRLSTYAVWHIKVALHRYIQATWSVVTIGPSRLQRDVFMRAMSGKHSKVDESPRAMASRIADDLGSSSPLVERIVGRIVYRDDSLDRPLGEEGGQTLGDVVARERATPEAVVMEREVSSRALAALDEAIERLPPRQRQIIEARHLSDRKVTLATLGAHFGLSKERIRQLESAALDTLRASLVSLREAA